MIIERVTVGMIQTNCYIIGCEETGFGAVIDPGDEAEKILAQVDKLGLTVKYVLLTHAHFDHIAASSQVTETTGAVLALNRSDQPLLEIGGGATLFGLPAPPVKMPEMWLEDGDTISIGNYTMQVLFTPGHTPGHVSFYCRQADALFDGDVLFAGSIGRTDLPGGNYETLMDSIAHKLMTLPNQTVVYSGHGAETTIGQERASNPFL